jgi:hypothetical protein
VTRMRVGLTLLILAVFLGAGAQVSFAVPDPALEGTATGATGSQGAQQSTTCAEPKLSGLPKRPKFTNATIHYKLTNMTVGSTYLIKAGPAEVGSGGVTQSTVKGSFLLPDQGQKDKKVPITAIVYHETCENGPWKLQKKINFNAIVTPAPAAPGGPAGPAADAPAPVTPIKALPTPKPVKPAKLPRPITQQLPNTGPSPTKLTWLTPLDGGARLDQKLNAPALDRLELQAEEANSKNALFGLGVVGVLFGIATIGGYFAFRRRDEVLFEKAMTEQLKHLEEGDPGLEFAEEPDSSPFRLPEEAPFADTTEPPATEPLPEPAHANGSPNGVTVPVAATTEELARHRAAVEAELQRVLNEAGLEAGLDGILQDARTEAERHGLALDSEVILQALCEEINGSARLSDLKRSELRTMFKNIIAEEAEHIPSAADKVPAQ